MATVINNITTAGFKAGVILFIWTQKFGSATNTYNIAIVKIQLTPKIMSALSDCTWDSDH